MKQLEISFDNNDLLKVRWKRKIPIVDDSSVIKGFKDETTIVTTCRSMNMDDAISLIIYIERASDYGGWNEIIKAPKL